MTPLHPDKVYLLRTNTGGMAAEGAVASFESYRQLAFDALTALEFSLPDAGRIALKPNATVLFPADRRVITHPGFLGGMLDYLLSQGVSAERLLVADGQSGENPSEGHTWRGAGYLDAMADRGVTLKCLNDEPVKPIAVADGAVYDSYPIYADVADCNFLFNVPLAKCHNLGCTTLAIKNLMGVIGRPERHLCATQVVDEPLGEELWRLTPSGLSLFEDRFYDKLCDLVTAVRSLGMPRLCVVDGLIGRDGTAFNEGENYPLGWTLLGVNEVHVDAVATYLMGLDPTATPYLRAAARRGLGTIQVREIEVVDLDGGHRLSADELAAARRAAPLMPICRHEGGYYNRFRADGAAVPWQIDRINEQRQADGEAAIAVD